MFTCNTSKWLTANPVNDANGNRVLCQKAPFRLIEVEDMRNGMRDSIDPMMQAQMGICGTNVDLLPATAVTTAGVKYFGIQIINATTFETATILDKGAAKPLWAGIVFPAGITVYGEFSSIKILTGMVRCYEHPFNT